MGTRGPLRVPTSIRGEREKRKARRVKPQEPASTPIIPAWLPIALQPSWTQTVSDLATAGVLLERIDSEAVAMFVLSTHECQKAAASAERARDDKDRLSFLGKAARFSRDSLQWANQIGATPAARARMRINPPANNATADAEVWANL